MSTRERLTLAAALAVALGAAAVAPLYEDLLWLPRALGAIASVAAVGLLCRRVGVPAILQPVAALLALVEFVSLTFAHSTMHLGIVPSSETVSALHALVTAGMDDVSQLAPPVPTNEGLTLLAVLGVGAVAVAVDLLAVVLGRAALAGLPLLVLFAVPSAVRPDGLGWLPFTLAAAGWLALLLVEGSDRVGRWGTPLKAARPTRAVYEDTSLGRVGRRIGAAALGVAVVVPAMVPGLDGRLLGGGGGDGTSGTGSRTTTTYNPITRLRDELQLPVARVVLTYNTDDPSPDYLRMTTLDQFSDAGWSASKLTGSQKRNGVDRGLPRPIGQTSVDAYDVHAKISIKSLDAQWLPTPFPAKAVDVSGPWLYDDRSETVFGIRTGTKKLKKSYSVTAARLSPNPAVLNTVATDAVPPELVPYKTPPDVAQEVRVFTARAVGGATTPYAKVTAIQNWFQDPANNFEYSTSSTVQGINSPSALVDFLKGRRGFCEQYASAMAAMIRLIGVPARVAIGFTRGTQQPDRSWTVTTKDAHAWPEAWFPGAGWIRFEPTPRSQVDDQAVVPAYTVSSAPSTAGPGDPTAPKGGATDGTGGDSALQRKLDRLDPDASVAAPVTPTSSTGSSLPPLWLLVLVLVLVVTLLPTVLHALRRRHRWADPGPLVAWRQVQDDAVDVGHHWLPQDSPRAAAAHLASARSLDPEAQQALDRLARAAERARYARSDSAGATAHPAFKADAAIVRTGLLAGAPTRTRWQARLAPTSTLRWASSATATWVADLLDRVDDTWTAIKRRIVPRRARAI